MYLILVGAPGAGKGTQATVVKEKMGLPHVATGDLFREAQRQGTELGLLAKSYMEKGQLVPDEVTVKMVMERLSAPDCARGCLLDGFPRTLEQARALEQALKGQGKSVAAALYIKVSEGELLRRLSGRWICRQCQAPYHLVSAPPKVKGKCDQCGGELYQRADDTIETARKRLEVYFNQTMPLIEYYRQAGRLKEIDGEHSVEAVGKELLGVLASLEGGKRVRK